jgi:calcineurin-like phosphoesterase family protein
MPNTYVIADTHFGHKAIIEFEGKLRPFKTIEEHDEALIENWNRTVTPFDTVIHLGDVLFGGKSFQCLNRLNGVKKPGWVVMTSQREYAIDVLWRHLKKSASRLPGGARRLLGENVL